MGICVNPGNDEFKGYVEGRIFVDKTGLIQITNSAIGLSADKRIVVSRPRRFGKTVAVSMLKAYYSCGCDSRDLFHGLAIESTPSYEKHLNKHNVISVDVQEIYQGAITNHRLDTFRNYISEKVNNDLAIVYPNEVHGNEKNLASSLLAIHSAHGTTFVILFDEWDVIYREERHNEELVQNYTGFLRSLFKNNEMSECIDLVYMTGILPIPKEVTQSGVNNFREYTMLRPGRFGKYFGFTESETESLCRKYHMPHQKVKEWYEGYQFGSVGSVYCPASVVDAISEREIRSYWQRTGAASELFDLMNAVDPQIQEAVRDLLAGTPVGFSVEDYDGIDLTDLGTLETVLAALVHMGYLTYQNGAVHIPNREVAAEFFKELKKSDKNPAYRVMARSKELLEKTLSGDEDAVAEILEENHNMYSSALSYNHENDLTLIIIASYMGSFENNYTFVREFPAGRGFADIIFLPKRPGKIPIVIELKWDQTADTAIRQIKERRYTARFHGSVLLVGVSYEKDPDKPGYKKHSCVIEQVNVP